MDKKVLILCTGNSCRSIIAEALVNSYLDGIKAYSCGVNPAKVVNKSAKRVLIENGCWSDEYHSKELDELDGIDFDLVVTVCDHAKESCPNFPKDIKKLHVAFEDPDGKDYSRFIDSFQEIKDRLLPIIKDSLHDRLDKNVQSISGGVKVSFKGAVKKQNIIKMVENCATNQCECMSDETKKRITDMRVDGIDGDVELNLQGDIKIEEIEKALAKSKILNKES